MTTSFAVIGGGKLGTAMGKQLVAAGYRITGVCCRTAASALRAAAVIGTEKAVTEPGEITRRAELVLITTPDDAIAETYKSIAAGKGFADNATVLHCSGSLPSTILTAPGDAAIAKGSFHPLQSFAAIKISGNPFQGIIAAIEGDARALKMAAQLGEALGASCFTIRTDSKALYHAAAAVASNYLVTIADISFSFLESAGISRKDAIMILYPLIAGTLANIKTVGVPEALTGPISRGDVKTIGDHLENIRVHNKNLLEIYSQLGIHTIGLALKKGSITASQAEALRRLLE